MECELPKNTKKVVSLSYRTDEAEVFCGILLIYFFLDVLVYINILVLSTKDIIFIRTDSVTFMLERKDISALNGILLEDGFFYLKSTELECLPFVDEDAVVLFVLAVEHLPDLHAASLEIAVG